MYIGDYLRELLVQNNEVSVPGLGVFYLVRKSAHYSEQEGKFYPPYRELQFIAKPKDDNQFINYLADKRTLVKAIAIFITEKQVNDLLENAKNTLTELHGIGWFSFENDQLVFKPNNQSVTDSSLFGYAPISLNPPIKEQEISVDEADLNPPSVTVIEHPPLENYLRGQPFQTIDNDFEFEPENIIEPAHPSAIEPTIASSGNTAIEENSIREQINEPEQVIEAVQATEPENDIEPYGHIHFDQPIEDERANYSYIREESEHIAGEEHAKTPEYPQKQETPIEDERVDEQHLHEESEHDGMEDYALQHEYPPLNTRHVEEEEINYTNSHSEIEAVVDEEPAIKPVDKEPSSTEVTEQQYFEPDISTKHGKSEIVWSFNDAKDEVSNHIAFEANPTEVFEEQAEHNKIIAEPIEQSPIEEAYIEEEEYEETPKRRLSGWAIFFIFFGIVATGFAGLYYYVPTFATNVTSTYRNILGISTIDSTKIKPKPNLIKRDTVIDTTNKKTVFVEGSQVKVIYFKIIDGKYLKLTQARAEVRRLKGQGVDAEILSNIPGIYLNVSAGSYPTYDKAYKAMKALMDAGKINKNSKIIETFQK